MKKFCDITGKKFGNWTVIGFYNEEKGFRKWLCDCSCGTKNKYVYEYNLFKGNSKSCGCLNIKRFKDIVGKKFGRLLVLERTKNNSKSRPKTAFWRCRCDCGKIISVEGCSLRGGNTKSCGCLNRENAQNMGRKRAKDISGERFGIITVLKRDEKNRDKWICQCDCGTIKSIWKSCLIKGFANSCGCRPIEKQNLIGQKFGRLTVIDFVGDDGKNQWLWKCKCNCGNNQLMVRSSRVLKQGIVRSCGCIRKEMVGKNHPCWNHELTEEDRSTNRNLLPELKEWRTEIYKRDNYVCQVCGYNKGGILTAHHKNGWDSFKNQRFDVNNGVTCCEKCHKNFHYIYGYGHNTEEQWKEFTKGIVVNQERIKIYNPAKDMKGKIFGSLIVIKRDPENSKKWICLCKCGNYKSIYRSSLNDELSKDCGCERRKKISLEGQKFGRLTVIKKTGIDKNRNILWYCNCDCGNNIIKNTTYLKNNSNPSCGCVSNLRRNKDGK